MVLFLVFIGFLHCLDIPSGAKEGAEKVRIDVDRFPQGLKPY